MPVKNNPLAPFIKGDSGGCLVRYDTNFEISKHLIYVGWVKRSEPITTIFVGCAPLHPTYTNMS